MAWKKWVGIGLIVLSAIWFAAFLIVPFAPSSIETKAVLAMTFLILMEVSFWVGAAILGKQVVSRYLRSLRSRKLTQSVGKDDERGRNRKT